MQIGISVISLFFILVYPFLLLPYGLDYTDNFYYATAFTGQRTCNVLTFFFPFLGKAWLAFAPNTLVSLRIFGTLLWIAVNAVPIGVVLYAFGADKRYILASSALGIVMAMAVPRVIGLDLIAAFWGGLLFVVIVLHLKDKRYLLLPIGALTGVFVAARFPVLLAVFPILFVHSWKGLKDKKPVGDIIRDNGIVLFSAAVVYFMLYAVFGSQSGSLSPAVLLTEYFASFKAFRLSHSDTYSLERLLQAYIRDAATVLKMVGVLVLLFMIWQIGTRYRRYTGLLWVIVIALLSYYLYYDVLGTPYSWNFSLFWSSTTILLTVLVFLLSFEKKDTLWMQIAFLGICFGVVSAVGSNTGLLKMLWAYSYVLPIMVFYLVRNLDILAKRSLLAVLALLAIFSVIEYGVTGYRMQDGHWYELSATGAHPKLRGIYTNPLRRDQIKEVSGHISRINQTYPERETLYYGHRSWLFRYLDDRSAKKDFSSFKMPFDSPQEALQISGYLDMARRKPFVCIVYGYAENAFAYDSGFIGKVLGERGYAPYAQGNNYQIFAPSDIETEQKNVGHN